MPVITSKQHAVSLETDFNAEFTNLVQTTLVNELDGREYSISIGKSDVKGFCSLSLENTPVCRVDYKIISDIPLLNNSIQINSVYTHESYRGIGLAPLAYRQLVQEFDVISDTTQTEGGARHWQVKVSTIENVIVNIVTNFPNSPTYLLDKQGQLITYTYGMTDIEPLIWGLDVPDPRQKIDGINHKVDDTNETVVLVARFGG